MGAAGLVSGIAVGGDAVVAALVGTLVWAWIWVGRWVPGVACMSRMARVWRMSRLLLRLSRMAWVLRLGHGSSFY